MFNYRRIDNFVERFRRRSSMLVVQRDVSEICTSIRRSGRRSFTAG